MSVARAASAVFWLLVLLAHGVAAIVAWRLLPGGFPFWHARFFANRVLPALVVGSVVGVAVQALRRSRSVPTLLFAYPSAWFGIALAAAIAFPQSGRGVALAAGIVALLFALGLVENWRQQRRLPWGAWLAVLFGSLLGAGSMLAQRAPEPSTHPIVAAPARGSSGEGIDARDPVALTPWLHVDPSGNQITAQIGALGLTVEPRLAFTSRSPDRFWTLFAPARWAPAADSDSGSLSVAARSVAIVEIEARSRLEAPVYSHLNAYARLSLTGHRRLGLRFSACPAQMIEVVHADYPFGAPARLAYLDAHGMFRVVQASDAEKGPFTTLAEGRLARGEPLGVELVELADSPPRELVTIVFRDWSLQLSTDLSPTAGWGLPQNAVEFGRASTDPASAAYIDLTLAGTSVGRGWDSVGHRAGSYSNRMELLLPPT